MLFPTSLYANVWHMQEDWGQQYIACTDGYTVNYDSCTHPTYTGSAMQQPFRFRRASVNIYYLQV